MSKVLEISNLSFSYADFLVLNGLNLSVEENEFAAIIGENGAGKSTLMKLILGELKYEKGEIRLFNDVINENSHHRDMAYISQDAVHNYKNFPTTVEEVIRIHLDYLKIKKDIVEILKSVGLEHHINNKLSDLSGGQLQRVGLVLALIKDAKLILLDEPTTGIDKKFALEFYEILKNLTKQNKTIVMITHHLNEAEKYIDRVIKLEEGKCTSEVLKSEVC